MGTGHKERQDKEMIENSTVPLALKKILHHRTRIKAGF